MPPIDAIELAYGSPSSSSCRPTSRSAKATGLPSRLPSAAIVYATALVALGDLALGSPPLRRAAPGVWLSAASSTASPRRGFTATRRAEPVVPCEQQLTNDREPAKARPKSPTTRKHRSCGWQPDRGVVLRRHVRAAQPWSRRSGRCSPISRPAGNPAIAPKPSASMTAGANIVTFIARETSPLQHDAAHAKRRILIARLRAAASLPRRNGDAGGANRTCPGNTPTRIPPGARSSATATSRRTHGLPRPAGRTRYRFRPTAGRVPRVHDVAYAAYPLRAAASGPSCR